MRRPSVLHVLFLSVLLAGPAVLLVVQTRAAEPGEVDAASNAPASDVPVDFNTQIRPILSGRCFACHGPDDKHREGGLRLDTFDGATDELKSGHRAIVAGNPPQSELIRRISSRDDNYRMPPPSMGKALSPEEVELLTKWIAQGAKYEKHWSYVKPVRPPLPKVLKKDWPINAVDQFILARLEREGLAPQPEADPATLIRRVSLSLTGLPPSIDEVEAFVNDKDPNAYEKLVDRLLASPRYGEHFARKWLDMARYADSAGYADDPPRTIWGYRDYVIRSYNDNKPFDVFTVEQIAGDLLPNATTEQLVATAFHRNTQTNSEGGTDDEEFRNVAVVDRVNTTMAVWMGTTMACAQCHTHKYDPITQEEYFEVFAILNQTEDADRKDESPTIAFFAGQDEQKRNALAAERQELENALITMTPALRPGMSQWLATFDKPMAWAAVGQPTVVSRGGAKVDISEDGKVFVHDAGHATDIYTVSAGLPLKKLTAVRIEALPDSRLPSDGPGHGNGNIVVSEVTAALDPVAEVAPAGRFVRIELPGANRILSLAEVRVFSGGQNVAGNGAATQSTTDYNGGAERAIDGNTNGDYNANSTTHTATSNDPWWEVDLKQSQPIGRIEVWNRTGSNIEARLNGFNIVVLDDARKEVWRSDAQEAPRPNASITTDGQRVIRFARAVADVEQQGFPAVTAIDGSTDAENGWATLSEPGSLTLFTEQAIDVPAGATLNLHIAQQSKYANHTLGAFRVFATDDARVESFATLPANVVSVLAKPSGDRLDADRQAIEAHYVRHVAPELSDARQRLAEVEKEMAGIAKSTVPVLRERPADKHRKTHIQMRGNFLDKGKEVTADIPEVFHDLPADVKQPDRLALAKWLVADDNPLTARVVANRYWETLFGHGIVLTSEEFGSQGDLPVHPELLDWLAVELQESDWNIKQFVKLLVMSAAYRQSSKVTPELIADDPENRLLARGPRFRVSAEVVRDQALFVSGLLSDKMYGPPVRPPQPRMGLSAAFGGGTDWETSAGEDRYRRGIYTQWRRSNPYPSMATFDAPNREACTLKRSRTNTPLHALVTMNDPVYIEAAQALARRMMAEGGATQEQRVRYGIALCLGRDARPQEVSRIVQLQERAAQEFADDPAAAKAMATEPIGAAPQGVAMNELAAWTVVGNVLLNLDEMFMPR